MLLLKLYISFFQIGIWGFGGGYAILALIQNEVVVKQQWITAQEFVDIVAISQITPGPISINCATYIGYTITGSVWGAAVATIGVATPSFLLMLFASLFYIKLKSNKYVSIIMRTLRPVTIGLILSAVFILVNKSNFIDYWSILLFLGAFLASYKNINPMYIILASALLGFLLYY